MMATERRAFLRNAAVGTLALRPCPVLARDPAITLVTDATDATSGRSMPCTAR